MKWFKSCLTAVIIGFFAVPSVQADDVGDINKLVKKKVTIIFDLLGQKDADVNERNEKIVSELNEIIDFISSNSKFMPHLHIPLQSGSDRILKKMKSWHPLMGG